ncbi:hypothetical protein [Flavobacterium sp. UBA4197]|uniref:hypothetical protein n=1 Tax=Flavobacterium sp. UBA4197 TaxID=1946546 RepID=UPI00257ED9F5|nr:hypothetical protein [Flavobacterium sp. UBA4197]
MKIFIILLSFISLASCDFKNSMEQDAENYITVLNKKEAEQQGKNQNHFGKLISTIEFGIKMTANDLKL